MFRGEPLFKEYLRTIPRERKRTIDFLVELNARLANDINYLIRMEPGVQTCEETLTLGSGSCRDSAWLLVQIVLWAAQAGLRERREGGRFAVLKLVRSWIRVTYVQPESNNRTNPGVA
jgi:hypothetical protein